MHVRAFVLLALVPMLAGPPVNATAAVSVALQGGQRFLQVDRRNVLELGAPWIAAADWKPIHSFPLDGAAQTAVLPDGARRARTDTGAHGTWTETITTHDGAVTIRYDFDLAAQPAGAHLQWYWRLQPAQFDGAWLRGEAARPVSLRPIDGAAVDGVKRLDFLWPDRELTVAAAAADGAWQFRDVRSADWARCYRFEYNRDLEVAGRRSGWFEVTLAARPARHDLSQSVEDSMVSLDGNWKIQVAGAPEQDTVVPGFGERVAGFDKAHEATYRRTFEVPESFAGRRVSLRFDAVGDAADVTVNGQYAGGQISPALPFEVDITDLVAVPSTGNRLEVAVRDDSYFSAPRESTDWRNRKHWIPRGMGTNNRKGLYQSVTLHARPIVHIADARVRTSVRRHEISVTYEIFNGGRAPASVVLAGEVLPAAVPPAPGVAVPGVAVPDGLARNDAALKLPDTPVELPGLVTTSVTVTAPFQGVTLWQPDHPALYTLRTCLSRPAAGQGTTLVHQQDTKFGFREVWFDGIHFYLNGIRCNLRGESPAYSEKAEMFATRAAATEMVRRYQRANFNVLRFHSMPAPPHVLEVCDELGMLVIDESAIYSSWQMLMVDHPDWMAHCREHLTRWVRRDRNHPSVVLWSAENEGLNVNLLTPAMLAEFRRIIDESDGSRPVTFDGDGTGFGAAPASNKHYVSTLDDLRDRGGRSSGYARDLRSDIYWATAYKQDVPLGCGEFLFPYEPGLRAQERAVAYMMGLQTRGYRLADWYDIRPYNPSYTGFLRPEGVRPGYEEAYDVIVKSFAPVAVFDRDYDALGPYPQPPRLQAGQPVTRTLIVYNDCFADEQVTVEWSATRGAQVEAGAREAGAKRELRIPLGGHVALPITFTPRVRGALSLILTSSKGGKEQFRDVRPFVVE